MSYRHFSEDSWGSLTYHFMKWKIWMGPCSLQLGPQMLIKDVKYIFFMYWFMTPHLLYQVAFKIGPDHRFKNGAVWLRWWRRLLGLKLPEKILLSFGISVCDHIGSFSLVCKFWNNEFEVWVEYCLDIGWTHLKGKVHPLELFVGLREYESHLHEQIVTFLWNLIVWDYLQN